MSHPWKRWQNPCRLMGILLELEVVEPLVGLTFGGIGL